MTSSKGLIYQGRCDDCLQPLVREELLWGDGLCTDCERLRMDDLRHRPRKRPLTSNERVAMQQAQSKRRRR